MKKWMMALLVALNFASFQAQATDAGDFLDLIGGLIDNNGHSNVNDRYPPGGYYGPVRCTYEDEGWEEHSRGHGSCWECLQRHGQCVETCFTESVSCRAVGTDYAGNLRTVFAQDQDRWYAERRALEYCRYEGLRYCRIERCDSQQQQISERLCR